MGATGFDVQRNGCGFDADASTNKDFAGAVEIGATTHNGESLTTVTSCRGVHCDRTLLRFDFWKSTPHG